MPGPYGLLCTLTIDRPFGAGVSNGYVPNHYVTGARAYGPDGFNERPRRLWFTTICVRRRSLSHAPKNDVAAYPLPFALAKHGSLCTTVLLNFTSNIAAVNLA